MSRVLVVPDLQLPFMHQDACEFMAEVYKKYKINRVVQIGDLFDQYFANAWGKTAGAMSTKEEFDTAVEVLHQEIFPIFKGSQVSVIIGNHDERLYKRADEASIHEMFLKPMRELYQLPASIELEYEIVIDGVTYLHGHTTKCSEKNAGDVLTYEYETNVVYGHFHSSAKIEYFANKRRLLWGFNVGCLIDHKSYAFAYSKAFKNKPILGVGLVLEGQPLFIPMILNQKGRWVKKI